MTALYTTEILRLAVAAAGHPRLDPPSQSADRRSATCGSRMIVDLRFGSDGRITAIGMAIEACAMGQAAAQLLADAAAGQTGAQLRQAGEAIADWLRRPDAPVPDWPGIAVLAPARAYPARHNAIVLPFLTAADAACAEQAAA